MTIYTGPVVGTVDGWLGDIIRSIRGIKGDLIGDDYGIGDQKSP